MEWHSYPKDKPTVTHKQYLVRYIVGSGKLTYAIDKWMGTTWYSISKVLQWAEIEGSK